MTMTSARPLRHLCLALATLAVAATSHAATKAADDDSDLPETLRRSYVSPIDGPADNRAYARGTLGLVRTSYGRASLYVAWRVMQLPVGALARESHERRGDWLEGVYPRRAAADEIESWLKARGALVAQPPKVAPDYFRRETLSTPGSVYTFTSSTGQCGPDAYTFATRTLEGLVADTTLKDPDRQAWIAGQDAVFARCSWTPGTFPAPALPAAPSSGAPAKLKALHAYQLASALFYGDDFLGARKAYDAIAATPEHPMRAWATLAALRSIVRETARDAEWDAAFKDAWTRRALRGEALQAAIAEPTARRGARVQAALADIDKRYKAALADATLSDVHAAIRFTVRRAFMQFAPGVPFRAAVDALDRPEQNPYTMGALDLFQETYPRLSADRPEGQMAAFMRQRPWFDFIVTVQGCSDSPKAPDPAVCDTEHAHAMARWQETRHNTWLLAALLTARQPGAADLPAAEAARAVATDRPEWASLQFHAARVLRAQGRAAEAKAALDALAASPVVHKRDRPLVEAERKGL
jgi:hypothetical protein